MTTNNLLPLNQPTSSIMKKSFFRDNLPVRLATEVIFCSNYNTPDTLENQN